MSVSTLCLSCGLCCDGSLFSHVSLQPAETGRLRQLPLGVEERGGGTAVLPQRCAALEGTRCSIYAERPEGCRRYRCLLLAALAEGEVSLEEALGVVREAQARVGEARAAQGEEGARAPSAAAQATWERAMERAEAFLGKHFRGRHGRYL